LRLAVHSDTPSMLVVSQHDYPGWSATVDGLERPVLRVNGVLQGVEMGAGTHEVRLKFAPRRVPVLLAVAMSALLFVAVLLCRRVTRKGKR
jgi:uncharacterized membrane protein YfhO